MQFFAIINGQQCGPYHLEELADKGVTPDTYVWCKGMDDWQLARDNADICRLFRRRIIDSQHPGSAPQVVIPDTLKGGSRKSEQPQMQDPEELQDIPLRFRHHVQKSGEMPGEPLNQEPDLSEQPPSLLLPAILAAVLCSPIIGIVAIVFATKSSSAWREGNAKAAWEYCRKAKMWIGLTIFIGLILNVLLMKFVNSIYTI